MKLVSLGLGLAALALCGASGWTASDVLNPPQERSIHVACRQYAYDPEIIRLNKGDTVRLTFESKDVIHGFYLEAYDIDAKVIPQAPYVELSRPSRRSEGSKKVKEVVFVADHSGKFRYRCSQTCGYMHPFMLGEFVVGPNRTYYAGLGVILGMPLVGLGLVAFRRRHDARVP
jgi:cytochrome c oxidase subunit 2